MMGRRSFLLALTAGIVALGVIAAPVIADELFGALVKVDVEKKKLTIVEDGTDKEVEITTTDETEYVSKKGNRKVDLEKLSKQVAKAKDEGKKVTIVVTHEKGVASKIARKKAAN